MISPSSPTSDGGGSPSSSMPAKGRREQAELMLWSLLFLVVLLGVSNLTAMTVRDAATLFVTEDEDSSSPQVMSPSDRTALLSEKLEPFAAKIVVTLRQWQKATGAAGVALRAAVDVKDDFHSVQEAVANLQMSLAEENPVLEVEEANRVDVAYVSPERQLKRDAFKTVLLDRIAKVQVEKLADDVRLVQEDFAAALSPEGAESIAGRVVDDTVSSMFTDAERARVLSEDEIRELSRIEVLSVDLPSASPSVGECLSAPLAQNITKQELERYGADRTAMPDYALGIIGAGIIESMTSKTYKPENISPQEMLRNLARKSGRKSVGPPGVAIHTDSRLGRCWPMQGPRGQLTVMLMEPIMVESVSLEHAAREILLNGGISAPKDFSIVGYREGFVPGANAVGDVLLSEARYLLEGDAIQFFPIAEEYKRVEYAAITLEVESNHGEAAYTCIYRFRVHGSPRTRA